MRQKSTFVALFFVVAALLTSWALHKAFASLFVLASVPNSALLGDRVTLSMVAAFAVSAIAAIICFMNPTLNTRTGEVLDELNKVNWPSMAETRVNTMVVIATSVVAALILSVFDVTFLQLSDWLANVSF